MQMRTICALDVVKVVDCLVHCWWSLLLVAGGAHMLCHLGYLSYERNIEMHKFIIYFI